MGDYTKRKTYPFHIKLALPIITQHSQIPLHSRALVRRAQKAITEPASRGLEEPHSQILIPDLFRLRAGEGAIAVSRRSRGSI